MRSVSSFFVVATVAVLSLMLFAGTAAACPPVAISSVQVQSACVSPVAVAAPVAIQSYGVQTFAAPVVVQSHAVHAVAVQAVPVHAAAVVVQASVNRHHGGGVSVRSRRGLFGATVVRVR